VTARPAFEFVARSRLAAPAEEVFAWHTRPGAFERLVPPWAPVEVLERQGGVRDGARVTLKIALGPVPLRWELEHFGYQEGREFRDRQVRGPFAAWEQVHRVEPDGPDAAWLEDRIQYDLPAGSLGDWFGPALVRDRLAHTFAYRHRQIARDLARQRARGGGRSLSIAISGASGMIGGALAAFLGTAGHRVLRLVRGHDGQRPLADDEIAWDPAAGTLDAARLEGVDAVVHLAGENLAAGRWTADRKRRIEVSRVQGTTLLARTLARLERPPRVLVSASAVGIYGPQGDAPIDETAAPGRDFLAGVTLAWEEAAAPAAQRGIRVVHPRFGTVLDPRAGALPRFLTPFRAGVGGRLGNGRQGMSWVALDDVVGAIHHAIGSPDLAGPINVTAPGPVTNATFTRTLAEVLGRPALLPVPAFALRALFGEMADSVILGGAHILPARLVASGFRFEHPELGPALAEMLGKTDVSTRRQGNRVELV
jgi:uncharacterized protein